MIRKTSVAGAFYPAKADEIEATFVYFNEIVQEHFRKQLFGKNPRALIVPHAGYVYSGFSANLAYANVSLKPSTVVVIGPSHRIAFEGMSMSTFEVYETPLGDIAFDANLAQCLKEKLSFNNNSIAHQEHSTEVQFPFIKHYFPQASVLEIVYSSNAELEGLIEYLLHVKDVLLIISTDLSHFYTQEKAHELDNFCIQAVEKKDENLLAKGEACGKIGLQALLHVISKEDLKTQSLDYRTSADITGDKASVVGYYSAMVY